MQSHTGIGYKSQHIFNAPSMLLVRVTLQALNRQVAIEHSVVGYGFIVIVDQPVTLCWSSCHLYWMSERYAQSLLQSVVLKCFWRSGDCADSPVVNEYQINATQH